jgi:hypothetical protein
MNTNAQYRRHKHRPEPEPHVSTPAEDVVNHLAVGGDPSLRSTQSGPTTPTGKHIAWVRPTDVHAYAGRAIGREIDLQAELVRRARRSPRQLSRAVRRTAAPFWTPVSGTTQEGLQL